MTHVEWVNATDEERHAEIERCKDPVYFYNTYWVKVDGTKPTPITNEKWQSLMEAVDRIEYNRFRNSRRRYAPTVEFDKLPDFVKPKFTTPKVK